MPNFLKNGPPTAEIVQFFIFFKMVAIRLLGSVFRHIWSNHEEYNDNVYQCAKYSHDLCSSFESINVSIFGIFN